MSTQTIDFYIASNWAEQRVRWLKWFGVAGLVVGLIVPTVKVYQAERRKMELYAATADYLADTDDVYSLTNGLAALGVDQSWPVRLFNLQGEQCVTPRVLDRPNRMMASQAVLGHSSDVTAVAISDDGQTIVSGDRNGYIKLSATGDRTTTGRYLALSSSEPISTVAIGENNKLIVAGDEGGKLWLWSSD